jgi:hypothetical protein
LKLILPLKLPRGSDSPAEEKLLLFLIEGGAALQRCDKTDPSTNGKGTASAVPPKPINTRASAPEGILGRAESNGVGGSGGSLLEKREKERTPFFFSAYT